MLIARSTFSCALAWNGDRPCETLRSLCGEEGWPPTDSERVSPSKANPFRPRYAYYQSANLPGMVKPAMERRTTCHRSFWIDRGGWGERALKDHRHVLGDLPQTTFQTNMNVYNGERESITVYQLWQKSERPVVAEKRGNACGAKGPSFSHVFIKIRRTA